MSEAATRRVLHVGCGQPNPAKLHQTFRDASWQEIRLDIDAAVRPDIVASITDMSCVADASVEALWSSHNLEHLNAHEVPLALAEFARVLKPAGFALITLPDIQAVAQLIADDKLEEVAYRSPAGPISAIDMVFGHRRSIAAGNGFMAHRTGFSARSLSEALRRAGFSDTRVQRGRSYDLWALARKAPSSGPSPDL